MTPSSQLIQDILGEFPRFRVVYKSQSRWSHLIDLLLKIVTLGGQRAYLTRYFTVMGSTLYVPPTWDRMPELDRVILLRHERVHLRQRQRMTFLGMALVYLIPILPLGLAYGRARLEWEAYTETLRATAELKGWSAATDPQLRREIVQRFCGPDYGWMWPFSGTVNRWYDAALAQIASETEHRSTAQQHS
ncbi:MAG TPA: hypothetical protein VHO25_07325 [Polyangiaceae bacterium]|nr:hypothetical protein [Polyangiaceae bacterium]